MILVEIIAQIENVIGRDHTFAREHINGVGLPARVDDVRRLMRNHFLQIAQSAREHVGGRRKTGGFRFAQEIHHVSGIETNVLAGFRRPVSESALIVLAAAQNAEGVFQLLVNFGAAQTEIRLIG